MIVVVTVVVMGLFLLVGWAVSVEMFQQRSWRGRVASGDLSIVVALIDEAMTTWRQGRPPRGVPASQWAGVQGAQLVAVDVDYAALTASAEPAFQSTGMGREQVASALEEAIALAVRLLDMMLYDVPNLRLGAVRVDVYTTFMEPGGAQAQQPILSSTATRAEADDLDWEVHSPEEVLARFETVYERAPSGQPVPIVLPPLRGSPVERGVTVVSLAGEPA